MRKAEEERKKFKPRIPFKLDPSKKISKKIEKKFKKLKNLISHYFYPNGLTEAEKERKKF